MWKINQKEIRHEATHGQPHKRKPLFLHSMWISSFGYTELGGSQESITLIVIRIICRKCGK